MEGGQVDEVERAAKHGEKKAAQEALKRYFADEVESGSCMCS
jgi:hypothetical protein